jgi:hypothetical protein
MIVVRNESAIVIFPQAMSQDQSLLGYIQQSSGMRCATWLLRLLRLLRQRRLLLR